MILFQFKDFSESALHNYKTNDWTFGHKTSYGFKKEIVYNFINKINQFSVLDEATVSPFVCGNFLKSEADRRDEVTSSPSEVAVRSFLLLKYMQWPHGIVPYVIDTAFCEST